MKDEIIINGVKVDAAGLMALFMLVFDPESDKWYRFSKVGDQLMVEISREERDHNIEIPFTVRPQ